MQHVGLSLVAQLFLIFGLAGLLWPERLMPVFDVLMFPWASTHRIVRFNSLAAILVFLALGALLLSRWI